MPPTGQLVCPAHPMQKPHLRAGMMFVSSAIAVLSSSSDTTTKSGVAVMKRGGSETDGAGHCMATAGRDVAMNADAHASMATTRTRTFFSIGGCGAVRRTTHELTEDRATKRCTRSQRTPQSSSFNFVLPMCTIRPFFYRP